MSPRSGGTMSSPSCSPRFPRPAAALGLGPTSPVHAQTFDPLTQSPMALMDAPIDAIRYYHDRRRGAELIAQGKWSEAEQVFARLTTEYPRDGLNWQRLGWARGGVRK